jgi:endonuclease/exonuclease/phosphatase family metal-dependent hydrolase
MARGARGLVALVAGALIAGPLSVGGGCAKKPEIAGSLDTLRVATYNLKNYGSHDSRGRNPAFRMVAQALDADVLVVEEMTSAFGVERFLKDVLNTGRERGQRYESAPFNDGPDTDNALFYKSAKVRFIGASYFPTSLRDFAKYTLVERASNDTVRIYAVHLKSSAQEKERRAYECSLLRHGVLDSLAHQSEFIVLGDFNLESADEPGFAHLIAHEPNDDGRVYDPMAAPGRWHRNKDYAALFTQSPRDNMDDRFDLILPSMAMRKHVLQDTYRAFGNDGTHFRSSIDRPANTEVTADLAQALKASDHLPVVCSFIFARAGADSMIARMGAADSAQAR